MIPRPPGLGTMTTILTDSVAPLAATVRTWRVFVPLALLACRDGSSRLLADVFRASGGRHEHARLFSSMCTPSCSSRGWQCLRRRPRSPRRDAVPLHMRLGPWLFAFGVVADRGSWHGAEEACEVAAGELATASAQAVRSCARHDRVRALPRCRLDLPPTAADPQAHHARCHHDPADRGRQPDGILGLPPPEALFYSVWPLPIYIAMVHDYVTKRLIHPVYLIGLAAMVAMRLVLPWRTGAAWLDFTAWLATF